MSTQLIKPNYLIKNIGYHARLKESEHLFRYRANLRVLMTQKPCAVGMRNAILRNHLKLEALSWKVLDSRDTFNVVPFEDLGARMGL